MEFPNEAATIETPHSSPPSITIGRLPKRLTNMLLTGPANIGRGSGKQKKKLNVFSKTFSKQKQNYLLLEIKD